MVDGNYLPTNYQSFIHLSRYSRWLEEKGRRETWSETVNRLVTFFKYHIQENIEAKVPSNTWTMLEESILSLEVMPSMRALMSSGKALERENIAG